MKKFICALVALVCVASLAFAQGKAKYRVYGVGFYNLENLFDTINANGTYDLEYSPAGAKQWNTAKYRAKITNMAYAISQLATKSTPKGPAILGVSEIENKSVLDDLVADPQIAAWNLQVVHHDGPDRRGVDVGLLYNPRQFKFESVENHTLFIESYPTFKTRDQMCVTGYLGTQRVSVIVNHWPSRIGGEEQSSWLREAAAALTKQIADSVWAVDPSRGIIVMGDMNDDPDNKSCAKVLGAKRNSDKVGPNEFYNPWWNLLRKDGIGTLAYKGDWNLFDQIIISGNLLKENAKDTDLTFYKQQVHNHDFLIDTAGARKGYPLRTFAAGQWLNGFSDHFPTEIFLKVKVEE